MPEPVDPVAVSADLRALVRGLTRRLRSESAHVTELPMPQQDVLLILNRTPGLTSAELARTQKVTPQSMGATVIALREAGLVETRPHPDDGRRREAHLTEAGRALLARLAAARDDWLSHQLTTRLTPAELVTVREALTLVHRIVD